MTILSDDKKAFKFLLLEGIHDSAVEILKNTGYTNIEYHKNAFDKTALKRAIRDAKFIGIRSRTQITAEILAEAEALIAIGCFCIGTNQVDLKTATNKGIVVFNAPFSNTRSVAELVIGELLLLLRNIPMINTKMHQKQWNKIAKNCHEARGKNLGIVGYGHIGSQVSVLAESLGMNVFFYDIETKLSLGNAQQVSSLSKLLALSDVVSLHVPDNVMTQNMIGKKELEKMKTGAILINAARGCVVDISALVEALEQKRLAGAAIDVFPVELAENQGAFDSPLCQFENVILTPHIGGSTEEAQENIGSEVAEKLIKYAESGFTLSAVNFPEVSLPVRNVGVSRLINIHENQPGMLTLINNIFTEEKLNIAAQYLQTQNSIGYVVIDIDNLNIERAPIILDKLKQVPGTIRARILF